MIGDAGKADGTEKNCIVTAISIESVRRHHCAAFGVAPAAPIEGVPGKTQAEPLTHGVEHAYPFGDDFLADAVAGNGRDPKALHSQIAFHSESALYLTPEPWRA